MIMGAILFVLLWGLMAASIALPVYGGWQGYRQKPRAWGYACCAYLGGVAALWMIYPLLDNSEGLRAAFGSEAHEGIGTGAYLLTWYIAGPVTLCSILVFGLGWQIVNRKHSGSQT